MLNLKLRNKTRKWKHYRTSRRQCGHSKLFKLLVFCVESSSEICISVCIQHKQQSQTLVNKILFFFIFFLKVLDNIRNLCKNKDCLCGKNQIVSSAVCLWPLLHPVLTHFFLWTLHETSSAEASNTCELGTFPLFSYLFKVFSQAVNNVYSFLFWWLKFITFEIFRGWVKLLPQCSE